MYPASLNSNKPIKTHYMNSFRENYLNRVLYKLQELLDDHEAMYMNEEWYDGIFLNEDCEETLGFVFVACQVFITGTIADASGKGRNTEIDFKDKERLMKDAPRFLNQRSKVELINAVANYYKHKDEGIPKGETKRILDAYDLLSKEFLINEAFTLITGESKLESLSSFLFSWRNHVFNTLLNGLPAT
jgi:hypothetical protein